MLLTYDEIFRLFLMILLIGLFCFLIFSLVLYIDYIYKRIGSLDKTTKENENSQKSDKIE